MACKEYELLQDLLKFSKSAVGLYDRLADLEIKGEAYSKQYFEYLDLIREVRKYEERLWNQIRIDTPFMQNYLERICRVKKISNQDLLFCLDSLNNDVVEYKRLIGHAQTLGARRDETIVAYEISPEEFSKYKRQVEEQLGYPIELLTPEKAGYDRYDDMNQFVDEQTVAEEHIRNQIELLRNEVLSHTFIAYLDEEIKKCTNKYIRNYLIQAKYRTICFNDALEDYFVDRAPSYLMPKLFQRCVEADIKGKEKYYQEVYTNFLQAEIEEAISELDSIEYDKLPLRQGGGYVLLETIYTRACNSVNPSADLEGDIEVIKQNALKNSKTDYAKQNIIDSFKLKKELTMSKNVDL